MFRTRLAIGLTAIALLGVSACSSDSVADKIQGAASETTVSGGDNATSDTAAPGVTSGGDAGSGGIAGMVPEECRAIYGQILGAMASAMAPGSDVNVDEIFGAAKDKLPADLQGDVETLATALAGVSEAMKASGNDPAAMAEVIAKMSTPEVTAASDRINTYFEETCPE